MFIALSKLSKNSIRFTRARRCEYKLERLNIELSTRSILNITLNETSIVSRLRLLLFNIVDQVTLKPDYLRRKNTAKSDNKRRISVGFFSRSLLGVNL